MGSPAASFVDDQTVADADELWRRIPPDQWKPEGDGFRVSSGAFQDSSDGTPMSVSLGKDNTPQNVLADHPGCCLAAVLAGEARAVKQGISRAPTEKDPHHTYVFGKKTGGVKNALAKAASKRWIVPPAITPGEQPQG